MSAPALEVATLLDPYLIDRGVLIFPYSDEPVFDFFRRIFESERGATPIQHNFSTVGLIAALTERADGILGEILGVGQHGMAIELKSLDDPEAEGDRVFKITTDMNELKTMAILRDIDHPNIVGVLDTFILWTRKEVYDVLTKIVIRDRTGPVLNDLPEYLDLSEAILNIGLKSDGVYEKTMNLKTAMEYQIRAFQKTLDEFEGEAQRILEGILSAARALYGAKIYTIDIHAKNIGIVDGRPVLFDVGSAALPDHPEVPVDLFMFADPDLATAWIKSLEEDGKLVGGKV